MPRKPDFIIVGAMKAGSTSARYTLGNHPDIYTPDEELHFFDVHYKKGIKHYEKQLNSDAAIVGEKTPAYCADKTCINRIKKHYPKVKLIFILREPISRAYSHWNMKFNKFPFRKVIQNEKKLPENLQITRRGYYYDQLKFIMSKFPKEQIYVAISEQIKKDPHKEYNKMFSFLGVRELSEDEIAINTSENNRKYKREIQLAEEKMMYYKYYNSTRLLYKLLGKIPEWKQKYEKMKVRQIKD